MPPVGAAPDRQFLIDAIPTQVWMASPDGAITYVNRQRLDYTGLDLEDALGWGWTRGDVFHPADLPGLIETWRDALASKQPIEAEARVRRHDGVYRWFLIRAVPRRDEAGTIVEWLGTNTDIDDRKGAEQDLRRTESYLAAAQTLSRTGSFCWNVSTGAILWSPVTYAIFQFDESLAPTPDQIYGRVHPDDRSSVEDVVARAVRESADLDFELRILLPDGSVRHLHCRARAVADDGPLEFIGAISDVTESRLAAARIERSEREHRQILDAIPLLITALSQHGTVVYANRSVFDYSGLSFEDIAEGSRLFHPDDFHRLKEERERGLRGAVPFESEARARRHDGVFRWFQIYSRPVFDERRVARWYVTGTDIDDRKRNEERMRNENAILREEVDRTSMFEEIVGTSAALKVVLRHVGQVAPTDSTVLITGETGTGKELVARAIHRRSPRAARAFVTINCAAIPPSLIASELFGHERGAFTGALQRRQGRFELADGGTIFLDEVGELPLDTQVALLRVLQEREFERVGGTRRIRVDVRVIAATNRDLQAAIADKSFRSDLFYRLNVFPIDMPALRDRSADIPLLVEYFSHRLARRQGKTLAAIDHRTLTLLQAYPWPGNIRELQNVIERALIVGEGGALVVDERWLVKSEAAGRVAPSPLDVDLLAHERARVEAALTESRGRVSGPTGAAARLGIPRSTLESRIRSLRVDKHRFRTA